jgi:hypothetical protein
MQVVKALMDGFVQMTFNIGTQRHRKSKGRLVPKEGINDALISTRSPIELSQQTRGIDQKTVKCEELRNYAIVFGPLFAEAIGEERDEYEFWIHMVYLLRAYFIPGDVMPIPGRLY